MLLLDGFGLEGFHPKGKCGDQGSRNYSWHHLAATAAIPELFGAAKHFCTKNADGKLSYKYKDIQSKYVGNLDKLKLFRKRMEAFDMFDPFLIHRPRHHQCVGLLG